MSLRLGSTWSVKPPASICAVAFGVGGVVGSPPQAAKRPRVRGKAARERGKDRRFKGSGAYHAPRGRGPDRAAARAFRPARAPP